MPCYMYTMYCWEVYPYGEGSVLKVIGGLVVLSVLFVFLVAAATSPATTCEGLPHLIPPPLVKGFPS